jgi:uncharacterized protein
MASQRSKQAFALGALLAALSTLACGTPLGPRPRPDWGSAEIDLERRCQGGSTPACGELGRVLVQRGNGNQEKDVERGLVLLEVACGQDDLPACTALGNLYEDRFTGETAQARGQELLSKACARQSASACTGLGKIVDRRDEERGREAKELFRTGCNLGDSEGCERLGVMESDDFSGSPTRAADAYALACRMGRLSGCHRLAVAQLADPTTHADGIALLAGSCDRGHSASCLSAALSFAPISSPQPDCQRARPLAEKACRGRQRDGCAIVDACRLSGAEGSAPALESLHGACEKKHSLACLYWADAQNDPTAKNDHVRGAYRRACAGPIAQEMTGIACGRLGAIDLARAETKTESERALYMLEQACRQSSGQACCDLAQAYRNGTGVSASPARASELRTKACELKEKRCCGSPPAR